MKKFTDTQKKWALTATMIAALGCSVSFNSHTNGYASLDLASEGVTGTVEVEKNKIINLRIKSTTDSQTIVEQSPAKDAEGKATFECNDCKTFIVPQPLGDGEEMLKAVSKAIKKKWSQNSIENAVMKAVDLQAEEENDEIDSKTAKAKKSPDKPERLTKKEQFKLLEDKGDKACAHKKDRYDDLEVSSCYADALVKSLTHKSIKIAPDVAISYYEKTIEKDLIKGISKFSRYNQQGLESYEQTMEIVNTLKSELPENQGSLYERVVFSTAKALQRVSLEVGSLQRNPQLAGMATMRMEDMFVLDSVLSQQNQIVMSDERFGITGALVYQNGYQLPSQVVLAPFTGQNNFQRNNGMQAPQVRGMVPAPGYNQNTQNGRVINTNGNRQINQGNTQYQQLEAPNSFNLDELTSYQNGMISAPTADQVLNGTGQQAIVVLPTNTSDGVNFGQPRSLSPQTEQARANMRAQQAQRIWVQQ